MSAADETVVLPPCVHPRVAYLRAGDPPGFAEAIERAGRGDRSAFLSVLHDRDMTIANLRDLASSLNAQLRQVRDERDGMRDELEARA